MGSEYEYLEHFLSIVALFAVIFCAYIYIINHPPKLIKQEVEVLYPFSEECSRRKIARLEGEEIRLELAGQHRKAHHVRQHICRLKRKMGYYNDN